MVSRTRDFGRGGGFRGLLAVTGFVDLKKKIYRIKKDINMYTKDIILIMIYLLKKGINFYLIEL